MQPMQRPPTRLDPAARWAFFLLGFALSGFFDGILLHQILQWHHLLSGLQGARFASIGTQMLADGLFHLAMYGVAAAGLWLLVRHRTAVAQASGAVLAGHALIGFGTWQVLDVVLNHWVLGLHRVRMDSPVPLIWDIGWVLVFGVAALIAGRILLLRLPPTLPGQGSEPGRGRASGKGVAAGLVALVVVSAMVELGPTRSATAMDLDQVTLLVPTGNGARTAFAFAQRHGAAIVDATSDGTVWLLSLPAGTGNVPRFSEGAWVVAAGGWGGCASWLAAR